MEEQKPIEVTDSKLNGVPVEATVETKEQKKELTPEEKEKMEKQQQFFQYVQMGGTFIKFVLDDLKKQTHKFANRSSRRRIEKELRKGIISPEFVQLYINQLDKINQYFSEKLNPTVKTEAIDGEQYYKELKEKEALEIQNEKKSN